MVSKERMKEEARIVFNLLMKFRLEKEHVLDFLDENKRIIWRKLLRREISYIEGIKYKEKAREYRKKWYQKNKKEYLKKLKERREMLKNVDKDKADKLKKMLLKRFSVN